MGEEKPIVIYGAIAANFVIAAMKYVVAFITGSSAMLSEALHSTADTGNELLLLLGLNRSKKPADEAHPLGHGRELYFWSLIVAILLFGIGAGMSVYEGITGLIHPKELKDPLWNYIVLGVAFVAEAISWTLATRKLLKEKEEDENLWQTLRRSKDPSTFVVFGEDSAALAGLVVAFLGIFLEEQTGSHYPDVIASLIIGLILALVAFFLAYESKSLLIGEAADSEVIRSIRKLVQKDPAVEKTHRLISIQMSPREVFLAMDVKFKPDLPSRDVVTTIDNLERKIRAEHKKVKEIFIEADRADSTKGKSKKAT